jgi:4a-hydroxytetrahydrobiopterin dehydratase
MGGNMKSLGEAEITANLKKAVGWERKGNEIVRSFKFSSFMDAVSFVNQVAAHAENVNHHPDILVQYNRVTLTLSTHDAGGLTDKDFAFAEVANRLAP